MAKKIASLYAEIGADTTKLKQGLDDTKGQLTQAKAKFDSLRASILPAIGIVAGFGAAMKGVYDTAKEGAAMEFAIGKFDRLAESAGTTADVLLNDLKKATRGTVSDMQLMGSAGDFMALGLAKSHDEIVRLTRVAGALGMDMNQLVLTLTNQTTMRFDALGVSVDGFDEKVAALKKTGMDAGAAFKEAFLQQAEEQIGKVGDKADTAAGQMAILEANVKNLTDSMKTGLVPAANNVVIALNKIFFGTRDLVGVLKEHETTMRGSAGSYDEYVDEMLRALKVSGVLKDEEIANAKVYLERSGNLNYLNSVLETYGYDLFLVSKQMFEYNRVEEEANELDAIRLSNYPEAIQAAKDAAAALGKESDGMGAVAKAASDVNAVMQEYTASLLFNKAAVGLDAEGALALATAMGLVEEDTRIAMEALDLLKDKYDKNKDGALDAAEATSGYTDAVAGLDEMIRHLQDKKITVTTEFINEYINTSGRGDSGGYGGNRDEEFANGGQFVIPPGYEDHSWPVGPGRYAESGETVTITPQGESSAAGMTIIQNIYTQLDYEVAAAEIMERIRRER